jgi:prolyl-tRNA synthetase
MNGKETVLQANQMYRRFAEAGIEAIFDDRENLSAGFKFKDADLLGMPIQVIVGEKGLKNGQVEVKKRRTGERIMVSIESAVSEVQALLRQL